MVIKLTYELASTPKGSADWRVSKSLPHLAHDFVRHIDTEWVVPSGVEGRELELGAGLWNEDLIQIHVASASMMLGVANAP